MYFRPWFFGRWFVWLCFECRKCNNARGNYLLFSISRRKAFFSKGRGEARSLGQKRFMKIHVLQRDKTINNRKQLPFPRRNATANMVTRGWPRNDESIEKRSVLCFVAIQALKSLLRAEQRRERFLGSVSFLEYLSHFWDRSIEMRTRIGKFE